MQTTTKTRSGRVLILPTPAEDAAITAAAMSDPDAVPFTDAEWAQVKPLVRRGRPLGSGTKTQVTLRLDVDVVDKFRATGEGWQTRINDALKSWVQTHA
ncbi:BrnA antitoxin family protein [Rhodoferax ferrireducens]|uniref:BrnA antitoxin family protein n=1 Tax=Rhodoferax ferrireducens TaxID=192843 RepID=UPI000E0DF568|nr:BrnA antitoxin family protein [Rhodoferax ferrireducens]